MTYEYLVADKNRPRSSAAYERVWTPRSRRDSYLANNLIYLQSDNTSNQVWLTRLPIAPVDFL